MSFLRNILNKFKTRTAILMFAFLALGSFSVAFAGGSITGSGGQSRNEGYVFGFAWMGTYVNNQGALEGGGGWLKFNCEPEHCTNESNWGTRISLQSNTIGRLNGEAWSNNYGFMTFDPQRVRSCWLDNPETYQGVATITNLDISNEAYGSTSRKINGWAKFIAGDDFPTGSSNDDGWDGCVNFGNDISSPVQYGVLTDTVTGSLSGWAWGGPVVGWISFQNPECPFCDTSVILPGTANISFWAEDTSIPSGGQTRLMWEAQNSNSRFVRTCRPGGNTSNYTHWSNLLSHPSNVGQISVFSGTLPIGNHQISGLSQTTTYRLDCELSNGTPLPPKFATVTVEGIVGCMIPAADNYNPQATIPDNASCVVGSDIIGCTDSSASNYNPNATIDGGNCIYTNPVPGCTIPFATNYNPLATVNDGSCILNVGVVGCTDPLATNYSPQATIDGGNCTYGPPPGLPTLQINVEENSFIVGSGNYDTGEVRWTSNNPSGILANSCSGTFNDSGAVQTLSGWTGQRANPNNSIANFDLTSFASSASAGDFFRFTIRCQTPSGQTLQASDTVIMQSGPIDPPADLPLVDLRILTPNNNGGTDYEQLSSAGANVNLGWTVQNAESCSGTSSMLGQGPNNSWNSYTFTPTSGSRTVDMTQGSPYHYPSLFTLTCVNEDGVSASDSVNIVIDGIPCPPGPPECDPAPGSNIPGYEEF
jgi:hypothetical protein